MPRLIQHGRTIYLAVATHFRPTGGTDVDAMQMNVDHLVRLITDSGR